MGAPVVHFEIGCRNKPRTEDFYSRLFNWKINNSIVETSPRSIGGHILAAPPGVQRNYIMIYVQVDDLTEYIERAKSLGGRVLSEPVEMISGTYAWIQDPDGNTVGVWRPWKQSELQVQ
jgi:hypothetical protein